MNAKGIEGSVSCAGEASLSEEHRHHSSLFQFIRPCKYVKCSLVTGNVINNCLIFKQMDVKYLLEILILPILC